MRVKYNLNTKITFQVTGPFDRGAAAMLHNAMYEYAHINAVDLHVSAEKGGLKPIVDAVRGLGAIGFYLGEPHKSDIIEFLDEVDPISEAFHCVNTVIHRDGKLYGIGMDGIGMAMAIGQAFGPVQGKRVLVIGAGAVGGLIPAELCKRGAASVAIANRTPEKANYIAKTLQGHFDVPTSYGSLDDTFLREQAAQADVLVQCSSVGNYAHPELKFESLDFIDALKDGCVVADVNYPSTQLLERAAARGLKTLSGESMMYYQQLAVIKLRFGIELPLASMQNAREAVATAVAMRPYYDYDEVAAQL